MSPQGALPVNIQSFYSIWTPSNLALASTKCTWNVVLCLNDKYWKNMWVIYLWVQSWIVPQQGHGVLWPWNVLNQLHLHDTAQQSPRWLFVFLFKFIPPFHYKHLKYNRSIKMTFYICISVYLCYLMFFETITVSFRGICECVCRIYYRQMLKNCNSTVPQKADGPRSMLNTTSVCPEWY